MLGTATAVALLGGCAGRGVDRASSGVVASAPSASPAKAPASGGGRRDRADNAGSWALAADAGLAAEVDEALAAVLAVRGLGPRAALRVETLDGDELESFVVRTASRDLPPKLRAFSTRWLQLLGLLPLDTDVVEALRPVARESFAGVYDPVEKRLVIREGVSDLVRRETVSHEVVHALQDQHFDLLAAVAPVPMGGDRLAAVHALAEGEATAVMFDVGLRGTGRTSLDVMDAEALAYQLELSFDALARGGVPPVLLDAVAASYVDGFRAVQAALRRDGWRAVDALWARRPRTTEQLLHDDKYLSDEVAVACPEPMVPDVSASELWRDVLGEQGLRLLLAARLSEAEAERAAAGWGGDVATAYDAPGGAWLSWVVRWDTSADGAEAAAAWERWLSAAGASGVSARGDAGSRCHMLPEGGVVLASLVGDAWVMLGWRENGGAPPDPASRCGALVAWRAKWAAVL